MQSIFESQLFLPLIVAIFVGGAAGALGAFMIMRRMALVGDALTHIALPGMGLALLWGYNPFLGAFVFLFLGVLGIWWLKGYTSLPFEALVGIFFTASLAVGVLLVPDEELMEALFGNISSLTRLDAVFSVLFALGVFGGIILLRSSLIMTMISENIARAERISVSRTNLIYLMLVAVVVALGVKFVGTLLMGALVIIPAAAAQNIARSFSQYVMLAAFFGVLSAAGGVLLYAFSGFPPGPLVVSVAVSFFILSFFFRRS